MKTFFKNSTYFVILIILIFWLGCKKSSNDSSFTGDELEKYENVINLQDEIDNDLFEWFTSMDSLEAIEMARQSFADDPLVEFAIVSSQGISVQYTNGMRGGIFLNPKDGGGTLKNSSTPLNDIHINNNDGLKSMVNNRASVFFDPNAQNWINASEFIKYNMAYYLDILNFDTHGWTDYLCDLDKYTDLSKYGVIHFSSHGTAWPKEDSIIQVYMLSDWENEDVSAKYKDDLTNGNMIIMKYRRTNRYWISKDFITEYNDFSNDTILFYGGFCYSFLGDWPDIVESCAQGTYIGFDWSVRTDYDAYWSENMYDKLTDTSLNRPMEIADWMNDNELGKSYWDEDDERTVHILYSGDPSLRLWDKKVELIPLSENGAPVMVAGEPNIVYPFKCKVVSNFTDLEYVWDIGDGSDPFTTTDNEVELSWTQSGTFELKVSVYNKPDGVKIGDEKAIVNIGSVSPTWNAVYFKLENLDAVIKYVIQPSGETTYNDWGCNWTYDDMWHAGSYNSGVFAASWNETDNLGWIRTGSIDLNIDEQQQIIIGGTIHAELKNTSNPDDYEFIDITVGQINPVNWSQNEAHFFIFGNDFCNISTIADIYYEKFTKSGPVVTYTETLESYSCDSSDPKFTIDFMKQ